MKRFILVLVACICPSLTYAQSSVLSGDSGVGGLDFTITMDKKRECSHVLKCFGADKGSDNVFTEKDLSRRRIKLGTHSTKGKTFSFRRLPAHFSDVEGKLDGSTDGEIPAMYCQMFSDCKRVRKQIESNTLSLYYLCGREETKATTDIKGTDFRHIFKRLQTLSNRRYNIQ